MRSLVKGGLATALVVLVGYAVLDFSSLHGGDPLINPRWVQKPNDGRAIVQLQLCWFPERLGGVIRSQIGPAQKADVEFQIPCGQPWYTQGLASKGERISLGWTMNPQSKSDARIVEVDYRVTINGKERVRRNRKVANGLFECAVGVPPCQTD